MSRDLYQEKLEDGKYYWAAYVEEKEIIFEIVQYSVEKLWRCGIEIPYEIWELNITKKVADYE